MIISHNRNPTLNNTRTDIPHDIDDIKSLDNYRRYRPAYTLELSTEAINYLNTHNDSVAIHNPQALVYTKDLEIINKDTKQWKIY